MAIRMKTLGSFVCALLFLLTAGEALLAQNPQSRDAEERLLPNPPSPALQVLQDNFVQRNGGAVQWNPRTLLPARISGLKARIAPALTRDNADAGVRAFLAANRDFLGVRTDDLALISLQELDGQLYVKYRQTLNGVAVEGNEVGCVADEDGRLVRLASRFDPSLSISTEGKITSQDAAARARTALAGLGAAAQITEIKKVIAAAGAGGANTYTLVYQVFLMTEARDRNPNQLVILDANTGAVVSQGDATPWAIQGTVQGEIIPDQAANPTQTLALRNVNLFAISTGPNFPGMLVTSTTGTTGAYSLSSSPGGWNLYAFLSGPYASVTSVSLAAVSHNATLQDGVTQNITWNTAGGADLEQVNVFYHINRLHDELYKDMIGYSWVNSWTGTNQFVAQTGYSFNNAYAGNPMTFGAANYARNADVIYHECTHNVIFSLFGGWVGYGGSTTAAHSEAYAFDEGLADFFSAVLVNRAATNGRNLDNTMDYAANYNISTAQGLEGHSGGQIIAGAAWDLREMMQDVQGANLGARTNAKLVFKGLMELAADPSPYRFSRPGTSNFFDALRRAADNNNNLSDGTSWDREIFQAFRNHGMLPVDVFVADRAGDGGDVPSNANGETWWMSPDIYVDAPPFSTTGNPPTESPEPNVENRVRVAVRNGGYLNASKVEVVLCALNLLDDPAKRKWKEVGSATVNNIAPNGSVMSPPISWTYSPGEILRAKLVTSDDPMTEPDSVPEENNLAQRNYAVFITWAGYKMKLPFLYPKLETIDPKLIAKLQLSGGDDMTVDLLPERMPASASLRIIPPERLAVIGETDAAQQLSRLDRAAAPGPAAAEEKGVLARRDTIQDKTTQAVDSLDKAFGTQRAPSAEGPASKAATLEPQPTVSVKELEPYRNLKLSSVEEEAPLLELQVPQEAKPGDVYVFHVVSKVAGKEVDGMTYEIRVRDQQGK